MGYVLPIITNYRSPMSKDPELTRVVDYNIDLERDYYQSELGVDD